ncbi:MAG: hypothetical protein FWG98_00845 [Candidatus Cloacimonetes bacterium]|nr:hypothetical protein [Candidatus Cloacimonadota bacterium]
MIKKIIVVLVVISISSMLLAESLEDKLRMFDEKNAIGFLQPLANSMGAGMNSGLFNTAKVLKPFAPSIKVSTAMVIVPSSDKTFIYESQYGRVLTGTVFGDLQGEIVAESEKYFLPKGADLGLVPVPQLSASIGLPFGNEVMLRLLPEMNLSGVGDVWLWGVGLKHCLSQYLPDFVPIDFAAQVVYQEMSIAEMVDFNSWTFSFLASKSILMFTLYGGLGYEEANLKAKYEYQIYPGVEGLQVELDFKAQNEFRGTVGARATIFPLVSVFADYSIASSAGKTHPNTLNIGVGVGF